MARRRVECDDVDEVNGERLPLADLRVGHTRKVVDVVERWHALEHVHQLLEKIVVLQLVVGAEQLEVVVVRVDECDDLAHSTSIGTLADLGQQLLADLAGRRLEVARHVMGYSGEGKREVALVLLHDALNLNIVRCGLVQKRIRLS